MLLGSHSFTHIADPIDSVMIPIRADDDSRYHKPFRSFICSTSPMLNARVASLIHISNKARFWSHPTSLSDRAGRVSRNFTFPPSWQENTMKTFLTLAFAASLAACATPAGPIPTGPSGTPSDVRPPQQAH